MTQLRRLGRRLRRTVATASLCAALVAAGPLAQSNAHAALLLITPSDDDRGIDAFLDGNFMCCQLDAGLATATINPFFEERVALEFALAALPAGASIISSTLTLHFPVAPVNAPNSADLHGYAGDGTIGDDDLVVSNLLTSFVVNAAGSADIAIDPGFIQELLTADEDFAGFMIRNMTAPSGVITMWTSDSGFASFNPVLAIEYEAVAEPGTLVLVGTALALVARRARRSRPPADVKEQDQDTLAR